MNKRTLCIPVAILTWPICADEMRFPRIVGANVPGAPQLEQPFLVMAGDQPVLTEKHGLAAPALWDWDGDGKRDLLVGEFETNSGENFPMGADGSTMRVYRNVGTDANPKFAAGFQWARDTEGTIMEVPQWCCIGFTPHFYDLNADGRLDIVTGQYHPGEVTWYRGAERGLPARREATAGRRSERRRQPPLRLRRGCRETSAASTTGCTRPPAWATSTTTATTTSSSAAAAACASAKTSAAATARASRNAARCSTSTASRCAS